MISKKYLILIAISLIAGIIVSKNLFNRMVGVPIITLTKSGFSPAGVKVKVGTKIKFVNRTDLSFWPASDLHPNHAIYPEFDPKRALSPNEVWEFQFDNVGTFRFHDHLNPTSRGTVVVFEEGFADFPKNIGTARELLDFCAQKGVQNKKTVCLTDFLEGEVVKRGPDYVFELVNDLRLTDHDFAAECHNIVHNLGGVAYWKYAKDKKLPKTGSISYCGFGFVHGFMTEFGHHSRDFLSGAKSVCEHFSQKINYDGFEQMLSPYAMCYHGVGHGVAYYYIPDFADDLAKVIEKGAKDCRDFEDEVATKNCLSGLFGGVSSVFVGGHGFTLPFNRQDPIGLCRIQPNELKGGCYDNTIPVIGVFWPNVRKIASFFMEVEDQFLQQTFDSIGDYASRLFTLGKVTSEEVLGECRRLLGKRRIGCFYGFSQGTVRNYFPAEAPQLALEFCREANLPILEKETCLKGVLVEIKNVLPNLYQETLTKLTEEERMLVPENEPD